LYKEIRLLAEPRETRRIQPRLENGAACFRNGTSLSSEEDRGFAFVGGVLDLFEAAFLGDAD
jgi:hypothetical protein